MKKILLLGVIMLSAALYGQEKSRPLSPSEIATIQTTKMLELYNLSKLQLEKVYTINQETAESIQSIPANSKDFVNLKMEIRLNQRRRIAEVLTVEQRILFEESNHKFDGK